MDGCEEKRQNPLQQARTYFNLIMEKIRRDAHLLSKEPHAYGHVKIPVNCGGVFPNINKFEYVRKGLDRIIPPEKIFFWDDLHPQSPPCSDPSGRCFQETVRRMFDPLFDFRITGKELSHLKQLLFPVDRIELPDRGAGRLRAEEARRLKLLDHLSVFLIESQERR